MATVLDRLTPVLQLARVTTAFGSVANIWFVILWVRAIPREEPPPPLATHPLWLLLAGGALYAGAMHAFGVALNDILDLRRDRALRPSRPIASGRLHVQRAVLIVAATLLVGVLGATTFGTLGVVVCLVSAVGILAYNAAAKFIPAAGFVALALLYSVHMATPDIAIRLLWPLWLVMTHCLVVSSVTHALARKVPRLSSRGAVGVGLAWALITAAVARAMIARGGLWPDWVDPLAGVIPGVLCLGFVAYAGHKVLILGPGQRSAEKVAKYGALWLSLYAPGWLLGQGAWTEAGILGALALTGLLGMTVLRELYTLLQRPLGYRR